MIVILIDMDMPNSCYECRLKNRCEYALANGWLGNKRDENCPLRPYEERKNGKWIRHENPNLGKCMKVLYECSVCKVWVGCEYFLRRSFCPNCGAVIDERSEDE